MEMDKMCQALNMLPDYVTILGQCKYEVVIKQPRDMNPDLMGYADHENRRIWIKDGHPLDVQIETLYHEIMHVILNMFGLNMTKALKYEEKERICDAFATAIEHIIFTKVDKKQ